MKRDFSIQSYGEGVICSVMLSLIPIQAVAAEILQCTHDGKADLAISLGSHHAFGESLACIQAPFVQDMTACAPANGYGMSAPTGDARLVGITHRWQDYSKHSGPVSSFVITDDSYIFTGGLNFDFYKESWKFRVSRISGEGVATVVGKPSIYYKCLNKKQLF